VSRQAVPRSGMTRVHRTTRKVPRPEAGVRGVRLRLSAPPATLAVEREVAVVRAWFVGQARTRAVKSSEAPPMELA
jgi:hypothetical protein